MDRTAITIDRATADRLRRAKPHICLVRRVPITLDHAIQALLDEWEATHPEVPAA